MHVPCTASSQVAKAYVEQVAQEHGTESNVYRVRVLGEFPLEEDSVLIPLHLIESAVNRDVAYQHLMPVWGLDVARFGSDDTALAKRRGNRLLEPVKVWRQRDLMQIAGIVMAEYKAAEDEDKPTEILIDSIGLGAGVLDRCLELGLPVRGVNVGESPASNDGKHMRLRDELWWRCREWFAARDVSIPEDARLMSELTAVQYGFQSNGKLKVEDKDSLRRRGMKSPDVADALVLTFAGGLDRPAAEKRYERYSRRGAGGSSWMSL
jgi:hypothetical protein